MASSTSEIELLCRPSGRAASQLVYVACIASNSLTASRHRWGAAASVDSAAGAGSDRHWLRQLACSIARLPFGVAQRLFALGFTASRHGSVLRYVTHCNGLDRPVWFAGADALHSTASGLRRLLPVNAMRWELCTRRSRIASASVGSPTISYQRSTGTWLVMISEPQL
jgi:hypothetical protein